MKKIILFLSIIGIFCLTSCSVKIKQKTISTDSTTTENNPSTQSTNTASNETSSIDEDDEWEGIVF